MSKKSVKNAMDALEKSLKKRKRLVTLKKNVFERGSVWRKESALTIGKTVKIA